MEAWRHAWLSIRRMSAGGDGSRRRPARRLVGGELRRLYEGGATLGDLARATGRSVPYVRALLVEAGAVVGDRRGRTAPPSPTTVAPEATPVERGSHLDADSGGGWAPSCWGCTRPGPPSGSCRARQLLESGAVLRGRSGYHGR